jgi:hypothetical protein
MKRDIPETIDMFDPDPRTASGARIIKGEHLQLVREFKNEKMLCEEHRHEQSDNT